MARRLANIKTREQTGFDYVVNNINPWTPFGKKQLKERTPFFPGQEAELREALDKIEIIQEIIRDNPKLNDKLIEILHCMKDNSFSIERSQESTLSMVELFEIKAFLLQCEQILGELDKVKDVIPADFVISDTSDLLNILDPRKDRVNTFYIYEEFSDVLGSLRKEKRDLEIQLRKEHKSVKNLIHEKYGITLTPKFDYVVSKAESDEIDKISKIEELEVTDQDYMSITFGLKETAETYEISGRMIEIDNRIEEEEAVVREKLSRDIWNWHETLEKNCEIIGALDLAMAKASYAMAHNCIKPVIVEEHIINITEGRQLQAEDVLKSKGKKYTPIDIQLTEGVTCITGANMGGKTVSLKMVGMVQLLAQYGFFVPCAKAEIGLANHMQILIGDSQSLERGLSSFGSEMEELKEIMDNCTERSFVLVDEIASGTNPREGLALTKSLVHYLLEKPYMCLITTHYDVMEDEKRIKNMQVSGLRNADFALIKRELAYANRKERIEIIGRYMDYRLIEIKEGAAIPHDALHIAEMLGIDKEIIGMANEIMNKE
ncbi:MAG: hypothetical protein Q4D99_04415 [Bacillota bacterium]|nr:hypothetical protein [Bacillota bacterium]